ncbi:MAG: efflux RND transporter periplasmic adaptor subunit [Armatimonadia bacterium]
MDTVHEDRFVLAPEEERRRRGWFIGGLVALCLVLVAVVLAIASQYRFREAAVTRRDIVAHESLAGSVVAPPNALAVINCHCSAPVSRVFATVGQTVRRGDVLVELSHPTAAANYQAAQQELRLARSAFRQAQAVYASDIREAQQRLADARAQRQYAAQRIEIPTGMNEDGGAAPGTNLALEQADEANVQAEAELATATRRSNEYLEPYRQRLAAASQSFEEAQAGRKASLIRAPIAGQVIELNAQPGQAVDQAPDTIVATVADLSALKVHARLDDAQRGRVRPGMPVTLRLSSLPEETFVGEVQQITVEMGGQVTNREREIQQIAVISFINQQGLAKPEMSAHAVVETERADNALSVPVQAVELDGDGKPFVGVRHRGRWVQTPVQLGPSDGMYVAVLSGLKEGEVVRVPMRRETEITSA